MHAHFDKFRWFCYIIANISRFLQKFHFLIGVVVHSLKTQNGLELVLRLQFL